MLEVLVKVVFSIISKLTSFILTPLLNVLYALFPSLVTHFYNISVFLGRAFTYVGTLSDLFCIPPSFWQMLFGYFTIKYTIYISLQAYKLSIKLYNLFKP